MIIFQLLSLSKTAEYQSNQTQNRTGKHRHQRRVSVRLPDERLEAAKASRARHRAKSFTHDVSKPSVDATILSMTTDSPALGEAISEDRDNNKEMIEQQECESSEIATVKPQNTARERRRERLNVDLK